MLLWKNRFRAFKIQSCYSKLKTTESLTTINIFLFNKVKFSGIIQINFSRLITTMSINLSPIMSNLLSYCSGFQSIKAHDSLRNATVLDRSLFAQRVLVPALRVSPAKIEEIQALLKLSGLLMRRPKIKPLIEVSLTEPSLHFTESSKCAGSLSTQSDITNCAGVNTCTITTPSSRKRPRSQSMPQSDRLLLLDSALLKSFLNNAPEAISSLGSADSTREKMLTILNECKEKL